MWYKQALALQAGKSAGFGGHYDEIRSIICMGLYACPSHAKNTPFKKITSKFYPLL